MRRKLEKKSKEEKLTDLKIESEKLKYELKHKNEKRSDRGVETMFKYYAHSC